MPRHPRNTIRLRTLRLCLALVPILAALAVPQQVRGASPSAVDANAQVERDDAPRPQATGASPAKHAKWASPEPAAAKMLNEQNDRPVRVRIGLRLTPFKRVGTEGRDGTVDQRFVPMEPLRHTLRARLNAPNHFFVGDYHVESKPLKWVKKSRRYEVQLDVYRRYGAFGQLEEFLGSVDLNGVLDEQEAKVFVLYGVARTRLRDKFGNPILDVVAGFQPGAGAADGPALSATERVSQEPAEKPAASSGDIIRGRF